MEFYAAHGVLISQWYGKCSSQQYREAMLLASSVIAQEGAPFFILDSRLLSQIPQQDELWTNSEFLATFRQLPLRRFALLNSFNEGAARQMHHFLHPAQPLSFNVRIFDDLNSAYDWLIAKKAA
ncbi:hypothetical protein [Pontibacter chitinilyticus]|uniref:hypothetical protein n=1 Tax=Pontibacter chitinilyticus TaxID=2674989 RepID=UPI00321B1F47